MSFWEVTLELLKGFQATVIIFAGTLAAALPLGLAVCFGSMCRFAPLRWLTRTFIWIIRGMARCWRPLSSITRPTSLRFTEEASRVSPRDSGRPARCWA